MLEVPRHRSWTLNQTIRDSVDGPLSDLRAFVSVRCQIRQKTALKKKGLFENELVTDVTASLSGYKKSTLIFSLSKEIVTSIQPGDYLIDCLALKANGDYEVLMDPEPINFTNRPTYQS